MKNDIQFIEHKGFYQPSNEPVEVIEKQRELLDMKPRKTYQEMKRETIKNLIKLSTNVEEADKVINEKYNFKSVGEKTAFLKGMFDVKLVSKHDSEGISEERSAEIDYWAMLNVIISL